MEFVLGDIFGTSVVRSWEFNASAPVRSIVVPYTVVGVPLTILKLLAPLAFSIFGLNLLTPYFILVLPRITLCLLSFITDYSLYKLVLLSLFKITFTI
jgi:phosphatidylinositol glycan class Z